jgi:hypothetical protein
MGSIGASTKLREKLGGNQSVSTGSSVSGSSWHFSRGGTGRDSTTTKSGEDSRSIFAKSTRGLYADETQDHSTLEDQSMHSMMRVLSRSGSSSSLSVSKAFNMAKKKMSRSRASVPPIGEVQSVKTGHVRRKVDLGGNLQMNFAFTMPVDRVQVQTGQKVSDDRGGDEPQKSKKNVYISDEGLKIADDKEKDEAEKSKKDAYARAEMMLKKIDEQQQLKIARAKQNQIKAITKSNQKESETVSAESKARQVTSEAPLLKASASTSVPASVQDEDASRARQKQTGSTAERRKEIKATVFAETKAKPVGSAKSTYITISTPTREDDDTIKLSTKQRLLGKLGKLGATPGFSQHKNDPPGWRRGSSVVMADRKPTYSNPFDSPDENIPPTIARHSTNPFDDDTDKASTNPFEVSDKTPIPIVSKTTSFESDDEEISRVSRSEEADVFAKYDKKVGYKTPYENEGAAESSPDKYSVGGSMDDVMNMAASRLSANTESDASFQKKGILDMSLGMEDIMNMATARLGGAVKPADVDDMGENQVGYLSGESILETGNARRDRGSRKRLKASKLSKRPLSSESRSRDEAAMEPTKLPIRVQERSSSRQTNGLAPIPPGATVTQEISIELKECTSECSEWSSNFFTEPEEEVIFEQESGNDKLVQSITHTQIRSQRKQTIVPPPVEAFNHPSNIPIKALADDLSKSGAPSNISDLNSWGSKEDSFHISVKSNKDSDEKGTETTSQAVDTMIGSHSFIESGSLLCDTLEDNLTPDVRPQSRISAAVQKRTQSLIGSHSFTESGSLLCDTLEDNLTPDVRPQSRISADVQKRTQSLIQKDGSNAFCGALGDMVETSMLGPVENKGPDHSLAKANPQSPQPHLLGNSSVQGEEGTSDAQNTEVDALLSDTDTFWDGLSTIRTESIAGYEKPFDYGRTLSPVPELDKEDTEGCICPWNEHYRLPVHHPDYNAGSSSIRDNVALADVMSLESGSIDEDIPVEITYRPDVDMLQATPKEPRVITRRESGSLRDSLGRQSILSDDSSSSSESSIEYTGKASSKAISDQKGQGNDGNDDDSEIAEAMKRGKDQAQVDPPDSPMIQPSKNGEDEGKLLGSPSRSDTVSQFVNPTNSGVSEIWKPGSDLKEHKEYCALLFSASTDEDKEEEEEDKEVSKPQEGKTVSVASLLFDVHDKEFGDHDRSGNRVAKDRISSLIAKFEATKQEEVEIQNQESKESSDDDLMSRIQNSIDLNDSEIIGLEGTNFFSADESEKTAKAVDTIDDTNTKSLNAIGKLLSEDDSETTNDLLLSITRSDESILSRPNIHAEDFTNSYLSGGSDSVSNTSSVIAMGGSSKRRKMKDSRNDSKRSEQVSQNVPAHGKMSKLSNESSPEVPQIYSPPENSDCESPPKENASIDASSKSSTSDDFHHSPEKEHSEENRDPSPEKSRFPSPGIPSRDSFESSRVVSPVKTREVMDDKQSSLDHKKACILGSGQQHPLAHTISAPSRESTGSLQDKEDTQELDISTPKKSTKSRLLSVIERMEVRRMEITGPKYKEKVKSSIIQTTGDSNLDDRQSSTHKIKHPPRLSDVIEQTVLETFEKYDILLDQLVRQNKILKRGGSASETSLGGDSEVVNSRVTELRSQRDNASRAVSPRAAPFPESTERASPSGRRSPSPLQNAQESKKKNTLLSNIQSTSSSARLSPRPPRPESWVPHEISMIRPKSATTHRPAVAQQVSIPDTASFYRGKFFGFGTPEARPRSPSPSRMSQSRTMQLSPKKLQNEEVTNPSTSFTKSNLPKSSNPEKQSPSRDTRGPSSSPGSSPLLQYPASHISSRQSSPSPLLRPTFERSSSRPRSWVLSDQVQTSPSRSIHGNQENSIPDPESREPWTSEYRHSSPPKESRKYSQEREGLAQKPLRLSLDRTAVSGHQQGRKVLRIPSQKDDHRRPVIKKQPVETPKKMHTSPYLEQLLHERKRLQQERERLIQRRDRAFWEYQVSRQSPTSQNHRSRSAHRYEEQIEISSMSSPEKRRLLGRYGDQTRQLKRDLDMARLTTQKIRQSHADLSVELLEFKKKLSQHSSCKKGERAIMAACQSDLEYFQKRLENARRQMERSDSCSEVTLETAWEDFSEIRGAMLTNLKLMHDIHESLLRERIHIEEGRHDYSDSEEEEKEEEEKEEEEEGESTDSEERLYQIKELMEKIQQQERYDSELVLRAFAKAEKLGNET